MREVLSGSEVRRVAGSSRAGHADESESMSGDQYDTSVAISSDDSEFAAVKLVPATLAEAVSLPVQGRQQVVPVTCAASSDRDAVLALGYLCSWFILNVVITLYSKALFAAHAFPYPMVMTTIHMIFTFVGVVIAQYVPKKLAPGTWKTLLWFSVIFTLNIWLSNAGLLAVSVNLHQVARTLVPLFTMVLTLVLFNERYSIALLPPVLTVIIGVAVTVWGDMNTTAYGLLIVFLGCFFSSLKGIVTQKTQVGTLGLSSLDLLRYLCPLAILQLLICAAVMRMSCAWDPAFYGCMVLLLVFPGEFEAILRHAVVTPTLAAHLCLLGVVAFFLNFVSFRCAALHSPLTLNVAGNVKQVLTSLLGILMFGGVLSPALSFGIVCTSIGAYWYSRVMTKWQQSLRSPQAEVHDVEQDKVLNVTSPRIELLDKKIGCRDPHRSD